MPWGASRVSQGYDVAAITFRRAPFMTLRILLPFLAVLALPEAASGQGGRAAGGALPAFRSDRELAEYLKGLVEARQKGRKVAPSCSGAVQVAHRKGAASAATVVQGRVVALPNSAVTGAQVTLGPIGIGTLTSGDGSYRLVIPAESLPSARDLVLRVRRVGYSQVERTLKVRPTDSLRVDVSLCAQTLELDEVAVTGASASWLSRDASITNTQEAGVDEGGIVKLHGEHLVILRRGRLFTVAIGGDDLRPIAAVDAFGPGIDPRRTWYDELLVSGDKVVVIGFSYERGARRSACSTSTGRASSGPAARISYARTTTTRPATTLRG